MDNLAEEEEGKRMRRSVLYAGTDSFKEIGKAEGHLSWFH
jgi:hypothetical protein